RGGANGERKGGGLNPRCRSRPEQRNVGLTAAAGLNQPTGRGREALFFKRLIRRRTELIGEEPFDGRVVGFELGEFGRNVARRRERAGAEIILDRDIWR